MNNFLLDILALGAILSGILVITSKNPVISVLFLISVFVNVAGYLVLLGVGFIGISYIIVYVGAISILFIFVVMILNLQLAELNAVGYEYTQNLPLGGIVSAVFLIEYITILPNNGVSYHMIFTPSLWLGIINWFNSMIVEYTNTNIYETFSNFSDSDTFFINYQQIQSIGQSIYGYGAVWLIITSIILLLAIVGPITLSITKKQ